MGIKKAKKGTPYMGGTKAGPLDLIGHLDWYTAYRKFWERIKKEAKNK